MAGSSADSKASQSASHGLSELVASEPWHALDPGEVVDRLGSDPDGLDEATARERLESIGPNRLPTRKSTGLVRIVLRQFRDPLIYILLIAAVVSAGIGSINNAIFIAAVLLFNTVIGTIQEYKAETGAKGLENLVKIKAIVFRDGSRREVDAAELVPGDVVLVESGASVPADARILESHTVRADESLLTGESTAVSKDGRAEVEPDAVVGDRETMLHAGTSVIGGRARAVVCRTGSRTELGKIASSLAEGDAEEPPLVVRLRQLTRLIGVVVLAAIAILAVLQLLRGVALTEVFFLAVALAVSAIPAGLPVAITVALSIAASRMADRNVIVRRLPAVEGLGACTLIASDKTGTLTANVLTAKRIAFPGRDSVEVTGQGHDLSGELTSPAGEEPEQDLVEPSRRLAEAGVLCNDATLEVRDGEVDTDGDAVDVAFLVLGRRLEMSRQSLQESREKIGEIPFESERRYAAAFYRQQERTVAYVKGAAQTLLKMCRDVDADLVEQTEAELAKGGYRVIAVAAGDVDAEAAEQSDEGALKNLELLGLVGLIDPVREEVPGAIRKCRSAGVDVRMITGDHPGTGLAIGRELGIASEHDEAVLGANLADESFDPERVKSAPVYARIEPSQKTRIVDVLQDEGHFVAVTGDGANDAPALRKAHIGVSMGQSGTDVARGASDLILTDDNFASIVHGIEEGRIAYDNVRKVTWLLLATGAGEVLLFFLALGFGIPIPLLPVQLLWLNLVTNGIQDVALAFEKGEPGVLDRPPRSPSERVFNKRMLEQVLASGLYMGGVAFVVYYLLDTHFDMPLADRRNLTLLLMVMFENVHIFSCRSERRSAFRVSIRANLLLIFTVALAQTVHIVSMYIPGLSDVLGLRPVSLSTWLTLLPIAVTLLLFDEALKWLKNRVKEGEVGHEDAAVEQHS